MSLTKSQIKQKINQLERKKKGYEQDRNNYKNSLNYANRLVSELNTSNRYLEGANSNLKQYFKINGKLGDNGKTNSVQEEIISIINELRSKVIPNINNNINNLNANINSLNVQINKLWRDYNRAEQ